MTAGPRRDDPADAVPPLGLGDLPGLGRIALSTVRHAASWGAEVCVRTTLGPGRPWQAAGRPPAATAAGGSAYEPEHSLAYRRILEQIAPDEARIVRLLHQAGPQPTVDVHLGGLAGRLSPHVLARGLSMVGARAGVRYRDRVPIYLDNLRRLGVAADVAEPVDDLLRYQVVEVQPDVLAAVHAQRRARIERRSLRLTPLGSGLAEVFAG